MTKKLETFHFSKFLRIFRQIVARLRELEKFKGPTRKKLVVQWSFPKSLLHFSK